MTLTIFHSEQASVLKKSPVSDPQQLPSFDESVVFFLENLGEGGFATVQKAYDKKKNEFIAIKKFKKALKLHALEQIMLEDDLLRRLEAIRLNEERFDEYFLKYDGVFKDPKNQDGLILKMESGCANLENLIEAGKSYSCGELCYVLRKIVEAFAVLEEHGIANRDVKGRNIILVEDNRNEGRFFYKVADFGIGCQTSKKSSIIPFSSLSGITKKFAAPEVLQMAKKEEQQEICYYNPFLADTYSLGLLALRMINKNWTRENVSNGLLKNRSEMRGYERLIPILEGMLEEEPNLRWDFKTIRKYYTDHMDILLHETPPSDESQFYHIWLTDIKEGKYLENKLKENKSRLEGPKNEEDVIIECLMNMFEEHKTLYQAYEEKVIRPNEAKFHLDRAWDILERVKHKKTQENVANVVHDDFSLFEREIFCQNSLANFSIKNGKFSEAENCLSQNLMKISQKIQHARNPQIIKKLHELEGDVYNILGNLNHMKKNLTKAEKNYLKALSIRRNIFDRTPHPHIADTLNNLGGLYSNLGSKNESTKEKNLKKAEQFYLQSLKIYKSSLGEYHHQVACSLNNLGFLYIKMGNLLKSEKFLVKSLKIRRGLFGDNHSDVAMSLKNLGTLYEDMGVIEKAENCQLTSLKIYTRIFGENHLNVARLLCQLGIWYEKIGETQKAEQFYLKAIKSLENIDGEQRICTLKKTCKCLGQLYEKMGEKEKSNQFYAFGSNISQRGMDMGRRNESMQNLGFIYGIMGLDRVATRSNVF